MRIPLDRDSQTPLYQQIKTHLRQGILSGNLAPDTRLPASRVLAHSLGVNRITIESAYAELEAEGLIFSRVGSGTYVLPLTDLPPLPKDTANEAWPLWQQAVQSQDGRAHPMNATDMLKAAGHPHPINFASGNSDSRLFPAEDFRKVLQAVMRRDGIAAFGYGDPEGHIPLRITIAHILGSQGLHVRPEDVLITAGSQQAIALVAQLLLKPGDVILVESPTYSGALDLFRALGFRIVSVPVDKQGMQVEALEKLLQQHHPKLIYTIPNFHNPTGTCLSGGRRHQLIVLADRYNIPILEDDFVGDLRYDGRTQPALKALDPGGRVIYVSTFSKMLMPGLRVGFLVAEGPVYEGLVHFKHASDLATSSLVQRALEAYVTVGRYQAHLRRSTQEFRRRRDAMCASIKHHLPSGVQLDAPQGGLFLWLQLPDCISADALLPVACEKGVNFAPGSSFFPDAALRKPDAAASSAGRDPSLSWMRLNFTSQPPDEIDEGMQRLAKALKAMPAASRR